MIDYQEIIENLTEERVKQILDTLDIPYEDKGNYLIMPTYCHNHKSEDASRKLYYYKNNKIFMCYTSCQAMSPFTFLKNYYESQDIEYNWYSDIYQLIVGETTQVEGISYLKYRSIRDKYNARGSTKLPSYNEGVLGCFVKRYPPEWLNDNISKAAMDKFGIKYSISQNKIIIPHYDINGNLCGIRGRALNPTEIECYGKYAPVWVEGKCYSHPLSLNLYGLNFNLENIKKSKVCYLCESEKSALQAESFSRPNCVVAVCGSNFNKYQLNLLLQHCAPHEIVVCFDNEELPGEDKYFNKLYKICQKYNQYCQMSFVYDRRKLTKAKDSPTDNGEEIFNKLIESRVIIR